MENGAFRRLPAMDRLLDEPRLQGVLELYGRASVRVHATAALAALRRDIASEALTEADLDEQLHALPDLVAAAVSLAEGPGLQRVINATGILVHTNLGRSPLPADVVAELSSLLGGYCDLEMDLATGRRADRNRHVSHLLRRLCGGEGALVVNNNAGALVLVLAALAKDRDVVASRGELVEIGGSFRIPEILRAAGARLVEVGTTNRTRLGDYRRALTGQTALLLKVHTSNYRIRGFTDSVSPSELTSLGREAGVPVLVDEGSGLLSPSSREPLRQHDDIRALIGAGCDLVCGSGDKLLGGPQAGLLVGRGDLVARCQRHPLYRALRPDRYTFAVLDRVLRRQLKGMAGALDSLWPDEDELAQRLAAGASVLSTHAVGCEIVYAEACLGGGSAPDEPVPGKALAIEGGDELLAGLRRGSPPVVAYLKDGRLILDLRTVAPSDDAALWRAVSVAIQGTRS